MICAICDSRSITKLFFSYINLCTANESICLSVWVCSDLSQLFSFPINCKHSPFQKYKFYNIGWLAHAADTATVTSWDAKCVFLFMRSLTNQKNQFPSTAKGGAKNLLALPRSSARLFVDPFAFYVCACGLGVHDPAWVSRKRTSNPFFSGIMHQKQPAAFSVHFILIDSLLRALIHLNIYHWDY